MGGRRAFLRVVGTAAVGGVAGCGGDPAGPGTTAGTFRAALPAVGGTVAINGVGLGAQGVAVTRLTTTTVVAVSRRCTHQGCTVGLPAAAGASLVCPCHGSAFTTQGAVVNGPANAPLATYAASIDTGTNEVVVVVP